MTKSFSRRNFLGMSAVAAGATLAAKTILLDPDPLFAALSDAAAGDRVRFGIIGVGMQGSGLLAQSIELPGVECVAACDLYDGRHTLAREIVQAGSARHAALPGALDNKDIDCIVAAVPDHWHRQVVVDAVSAGKDIYCEKPMSHSPADGVAMVDAAKKSGRIVQIGSQRVSSQICAKAKEMIAEGMLGDMMLVEGWLGRNDPNGAWQYPPPFDLSPAKSGLGHLAGTVARSGRSIQSSSRAGAAGRSTAPASPAICSSTDQRHDVHAGYQRAAQAGDGGRRNPPLEGWAQHARRALRALLLRRSAGVHASQPRDVDAGDVSLPGDEGDSRGHGDGLTFTPQSGKDDSPSYYDASFPRAMRDAYFKKWHAENDAALGQEPMPESITFSGPGLRRHASASLELLQGRAHAEAGRRGRRLRS